ncbi:GNAT family N-acetyltransferase [Nitratireductor kimnyeongensis]|uniref:GNAT family N-acetyltransferase n=1 Tax=Nitratireductor kimnyeongensis TaxID=430679 RepID=A0ABW0TDG7_9HYPH|nr:GNAT family N-acetyltransferase [Nitratireductor kimnyeongensis]QZZ37192.1 GNAT family N-acetyltransferase [Nitratireductor kimnyeongensis]
MTLQTPILETERLVLRAHSITDFDAFARLWSLPETTRFTSGKPLTEEDAWRRLAAHRGMWDLMGFGYFAVTEKATSAFLGDAGVQEARRTITPSVLGTLEAGWVFLPEVHGRGYAKEAMEAVFVWCSQAHGGKAITCIIDEENAPSLKLAERLGFVEKARAEYKDRPSIVFWRDQSIEPPAALMPSIVSDM